MMIAPLEINDPVEEGITALQDYLRVSLPILNQIIDDFPLPNEDLNYPALSVSHDAAQGYTTLTPYEEALDPEVSTNNTGQTLWIVGQWDFSVQLDFWARNKVERDLLFSRFFSAFNPQIEPMGLSLKLGRYYNLWARYDLKGYQHKDDEAASQRQEWRTMVTLNVHVKHALTQNQFRVTQPVVLNLEITDN
jgi:hypothetical protein